MSFGCLLYFLVLSSQVTRPTVGVAQFELATSAMNHMDGQKIYDWQAGDTDALQRMFLNAISKTQKFNILNRDSVEKIYEELKFRKTDTKPTIHEFMRDSLTEATFLVEGVISLINFETEKVEIPYSKRTINRQTIYITVDLSLTEIEKGSIVFRDHSALKVSNNGSESISELVERAKRETSDTIVGNLIDELFPIKVIRGGDKEIFITLSKSTWFKEGQLLSVFELGEKYLIDPYTQEILGKDEEMMGKVLITEVLPKFAKAKVISSEHAIRIGSICRRYSEYYSGKESNK